ncbi:MAG: BatA and WFA domain-containing protein [Planctomycetota bacterium]
MIFLSPGFLWGFALLAPLVAVFLLKVRPRRHPVTAIFLWDQILTQRKATTLFQRLRDLLSLLLLALAAAALILAASRPRIDGGDTRDVLILIDRSVSMSADLDPGRPGVSRFEAAVDRAGALVRSLGGQRRAAIATVDDRLTYAVPLTDEPRRLREALGRLAVGQSPSDRKVLTGLEQLSGLNRELRVILLTDGVGLAAPAEAETFLPAPAGADADAVAGDDDAAAGPVVEVVRLGPSAGSAVPGNVGLAAADLVAGGGEQGATLLLSVVSSFSEPVQGEATLTALGPPPETDASAATGRAEQEAPGVVVRVIPLDIAPGRNAPRLYPLEAAPGRYRLSLTRVDGDGDAQPDALAADDTAFLSLPSPRPLRVAVSAGDRYFFETAVQAFAFRSDLMELVRRGEPADLAIFRGGAPSGVEGPPLRVVFAPDAAGGGVTEVGEALAAALPRVLLPNHPVLRFFPAESIGFQGARRLRAAAGSAVLVADATGVPLIWQTRDPDAGTVTLVVNLDPAAGDFVLSPYFPVLVHAAATHLGGRTEARRATYLTGASVPVPGLRPGEAAAVRFAEGGEVTATPATPVRLERAGFHVAETPREPVDLPASAMHGDESRLVGLPDAGGAAVELPGGYLPWVWLVVVALGVLVAEEVLYHRRKVG